MPYIQMVKNIKNIEIVTQAITKCTNYTLPIATVCNKL